MKKSLVVFTIVLAALLLSNFFGFWGANPNVRRKVSLIREAMESDGYDVKWFTISEKRNKVYNSILANSVKKSNHLKGDAVDVYVLDIDGDGSYTKEDIAIVEAYNHKIERRHPELKGTLGTYFSKTFAKRMIHFDTGGNSRRYER